MPDNPDCPDCEVLMEDHMLMVHEIGGMYPAVKCPKCGKIMLHDVTTQKMVKDTFKEREVDWTEHDRIMEKYIRVDMELDPYNKKYKYGPPGKGFWAFNQLISYYIRSALKYIVKSDKLCPRCGKDTGLWVESELKTGKVLGCTECDNKWFYEYPDKQ